MRNYDGVIKKNYFCSCYSCWQVPHELAYLHKSTKCPIRNTLPATSPKPTPKATLYFDAASATRSVPLQPSGTTTAVTVSEYKSGLIAQGFIPQAAIARRTPSASL